MAGSKKNKNELQKIYSYFIKILKSNNIDFIVFYGTLLGIVRDKDFIIGDDDIDVIVNRSNYKKIMNTIKKYNIKTKIVNSDIIQLYLNKLGPFDIYIYEIENSKLKIPWENDVYDINLILPPKLINFYDEDIQIPNKSKKFLSHYYGYLWRIKNAPIIRNIQIIIIILVIIVATVTIKLPSIV
uniref:LicD family protein n=1 Tax=Megaviridae environmental sample TaxID=1737588 RepID=A0A5J6VK62_9VIRU|nr:MAG: LicD family protein [Megaviridae environmental sample]